MRSSKRSRLGGVIALIPTSAQRQSEERPERSVPSERGAGLVLIVDDNSDTRDLYSLYFRSKGYTVRTAHDGRQGIDLALKLRPEAVVMDLSMPALDGISATKATQARPQDTAPADPDPHRLPRARDPALSQPAPGDPARAWWWAAHGTSYESQDAIRKTEPTTFPLVEGRDIACLGDGLRSIL